MKLNNRVFLALAGAILLRTGVASAEPVVVRHVEGLVHGFLSLRSPGGGVLANGDLIQDSRDDRVTSRLLFHFKDGSLHDETAVFSQRGHFQLISYHLVQKGPAFERPLDMTIDCPAGHVTVGYKNEHGEAKQTRGVAAGEPGFYFVGQHFQYAFSSTMIHGAARDAEYVADVIARRVREAERMRRTG